MSRFLDMEDKARRALLKLQQQAHVARGWATDPEHPASEYPQRAPTILEALPHDAPQRYRYVHNRRIASPGPRRVLLVGEAPGPGGGSYINSLALVLALRSRGEAARCGAPKIQFDSRPPWVRHFELITRHANLLDAYPGVATGRDGSAFVREKARAAAREASQALVEAREAARLGYQAVLLAGTRVAAAFGLRGIEYFDWTNFAIGSRLPVAVVPHPSGVNRWWNEEENRLAAMRFLMRVVDEWW